jgi:putative MATE family efflux protein
MQQDKTENIILTGPAISTFIRYAFPSVLGLLAITTASIVDGIFVGHFVSAEGLAAINLLIPFFSLIFGVALMLSIGGAVQGGHYLGQGQVHAASAIFSKCLISIFIIGIGFMSLSLLTDRWLLKLLGTPDELMPLILPYFHIICVVLVVQIFTMVLYYFIRLDNRQTLATAALVTGAITNIVLDALFIIVFDMGLTGAAWATAIAQTMQLFIMSTFFLSQQRQLYFTRQLGQWSELGRIALNGLSEFINEISGGLVILLLNWLLVLSHGVTGIAAFAVINYLIFVSLMLYYGIADALHLLVSHNHGAGHTRRIQQFVNVAISMVMILGLMLTLALLIWPQWLTGLFLHEASQQTRNISAQFIAIVWPLFLVNGLNVTLSVYLTAMQKPLPSMLVAVSRGLLLPIGLLLLLSLWLPDQQFLLALPLAEWLTFILACVLYWQFKPVPSLRP